MNDRVSSMAQLSKWTELMQTNDGDVKSLGSRSGDGGDSRKQQQQSSSSSKSISSNHNFQSQPYPSNSIKQADSKPMSAMDEEYDEEFEDYDEDFEDESPVKAKPIQPTASAKPQQQHQPQQNIQQLERSLPPSKFEVKPQLQEKQLSSGFASNPPPSLTSESKK